MLATLGVGEREAREHTPEWVDHAIEAVGVDYRMRLVGQINSTFTGAAAAFHGGEAVGHMQDVIASLEDTGSAEPEDQRATEFELRAAGVMGVITAEEAARHG